MLPPGQLTHAGVGKWSARCRAKDLAVAAGVAVIADRSPVLSYRSTSGFRAPAEGVSQARHGDSKSIKLLPSTHAVDRTRDRRQTPRTWRPRLGRLNQAGRIQQLGRLGAERRFDWHNHARPARNTACGWGWGGGGGTAVPPQTSSSDVMA